MEHALILHGGDVEPAHVEHGKFSVIVDGDITGPFRLADGADYHDSE